MTDEEKAEEYVKEQILKHNKNVVLRPKNVITYIDELKQAYFDGLAEGRKENEELKHELSDIKTAIRNYSKAETYQQQENTWNSLLEFIN